MISTGGTCELLGWLPLCDGCHPRKMEVWFHLEKIFCFSFVHYHTTIHLRNRYFIRINSGEIYVEQYNRWILVENFIHSFDDWSLSL
mgnify:CR=1 FL=1